METVGRYRVVARLGGGGMGEVFEAVAVADSGLERRVVLKRISRGYGGDHGYVRMFLDEARIASSLYHANIVAILDFGLVDGEPFQVLEHVDGRDLDHLQRAALADGRRLPVEVALHVCLQVAHALDYI